MIYGVGSNVQDISGGSIIKIYPSINTWVSTGPHSHSHWDRYCLMVYLVYVNINADNTAHTDDASGKLGPSDNLV